MADVVLKKVTKVYEGGTVAVKSVDLEIKDKEFVVLVGPSGCGKSTTLRMIAGLEEITEGELYIDDEFMNDVSPKDRNIAMVFQNYALYPHMTVYENMAFGLKLRKFKKDDIKERVTQAARILGIEELLERKPKALSGGQRQRVAVGRAIVRKPKVFLFDEPLSNLDAKLRVQMRTEISKLHQKLQATMIYVTHDQTEAMTMGDRIVIMKDGVVNQIDSPLNLYNHPVNRFVAGFIGSPSMNFMEGSITTDTEPKFVTKEKDIEITLNTDYKDKLKEYGGKDITLGIRPEDIHALESTDKNLAKIQAELEVVEPMGNEIYIYFTAGGAQTIARINPKVNPDAGSTIDLYLDIDKLHFFDRETGETIK